MREVLLRDFKRIPKIIFIILFFLSPFLL
jgi:hypothetical protein